MAWIAPPDANRAAGSTHACTSGGGGASLGANMGDPVAALRELLGAFFAAYLEDATELRKRRMSTLLVQADARGLLGPGAVRPLTSLFVSLEREMQVDAQRFAAFYHFVFFVARERGHRNLSFGTAVDSWRFVLGGGRFALLGPWCDFVSGRAGSKGVSEDTWCQVLDFVHTVNQSGGELSGYDPHGAWPVLVDEFVDHFHGGGMASLGEMGMETGAMLTAAAARGPAGHAASYSTTMAGAARGGSSWSSSSVATAMDQSFGWGGGAGAMVYNGGVEGGAGRGFGAGKSGGGGVTGRFGDGGGGIPSFSCGGGGGGGGGGRGGGTGGELEGGGFNRHAAGHWSAGGHASATTLQQPAVGCKRRLSAVLELDGLADQLERQARVRTPPIPARGGVLTPAHDNHDQQQQQQQQQQQTVARSPTRKYARLERGAPLGGMSGMFS